MMGFEIRDLGFVGICALLVCAPQQSVQPAFEVASVKIANPDVLTRRGFGCGMASPTRLSCFGFLRYVVATAYDVSVGGRIDQRIIGGPKWIDQDLYDIEATVPQEGARPATFERVKLMLRTLLAERFRLVVHQERREVPAFRLIVARKNGKPGPNLQPTPKACADWLANGRQGAPPVVLGDLSCVRGMVNAFAIRGAAMTIAQLVNQLSARAERPVTDETGLTGTFAIDLRWRPDQLPPGASFSDDLATSVFTAVQEQLGLKLESSTAVVDMLIIDRVERPTPN